MLFLMGVTPHLSANEEKGSDGSISDHPTNMYITTISVLILGVRSYFKTEVNLHVTV